MSRRLGRARGFPLRSPPVRRSLTPRACDWQSDDRGLARPFLGKVLKERLRILQIASFEAFGEPTIRRRQQVVRFPPLAPIGPEPGKIAGGSKLEDARRLATGGGQCGVESGLGAPSVMGIASQAGARAKPVQLRRAKVLACRLGAGQALLKHGLRLVQSAEPEPRVGEQHEKISLHKNRTHGRAPVEEVSHLLGGAVIPLLANGTPCGQDARFRVVYGEPMLVGEPREQGGAAVELFEFASELQQYRTPV